MSKNCNFLPIFYVFNYVAGANKGYDTSCLFVRAYVLYVSTASNLKTKT